jgi:hypothetical protein
LIPRRVSPPPPVGNRVGRAVDPSPCQPTTHLANRVGRAVDPSPCQLGAPIPCWRTKKGHGAEICPLSAITPFALSNPLCPLAHTHPQL